MSLHSNLQNKDCKSEEFVLILLYGIGGCAFGCTSAKFWYISDTRYLFLGIRKGILGDSFFMLRRPDSNRRPLGYEPNELPTAPLRDVVFLNCAAKVRLFSEKTNFYAIFFHRMSRHQSRGGDQWHIEKNGMLNERAVIGCHFYKKKNERSAIDRSFLSAKFIYMRIIQFLEPSWHWPPS